MSVQSEINRIKLNISDSLDAVAAYGVDIDPNDSSNELATRIAQITNALEGFVKYTLQTLTDTLKLQARTNIEAASTNDIPTIPTNVSAFKNDAGYLTLHLDISGKLDIITDLDTIRSGAALGATALLGLPSSAVTTNTDLTINANKVFSKSISGNLTITWNLLVAPLNYSIGGISITTTSGITHVSGSSSSPQYVQVDVQVTLNHKYLVDVNKVLSAGLIYITGGLPTKYNIQSPYIATATSTASAIITFNTTANHNYNDDVIVKVHDLTLIYGVGNEPITVLLFKSMFPLDYYEYNVGSTIEKALLVGSNLSAPVLYEGGLQLSDKYNVNLGVDSISAIGIDLYGTATASGLASVVAEQILPKMKYFPSGTSDITMDCGGFIIIGQTYLGANVYVFGYNSITKIGGNNTNIAPTMTEYTIKRNVQSSAYILATP